MVFLEIEETYYKYNLYWKCQFISIVRIVSFRIMASSWSKMNLNTAKWLQIRVVWICPGPLSQIRPCVRSWQYWTRWRHKLVQLFLENLKGRNSWRVFVWNEVVMHLKSPLNRNLGNLGCMIIRNYQRQVVISWVRYLYAQEKVKWDESAKLSISRSLWYSFK